MGWAVGGSYGLQRELRRFWEGDENLGQLRSSLMNSLLCCAHASALSTAPLRWRRIWSGGLGVSLCLSSVSLSLWGSQPRVTMTKISTEENKCINFKN